jgi:hypothetical protein
MGIGMDSSNVLHVKRPEVPPVPQPSPKRLP